MPGMEARLRGHDEALAGARSSANPAQEEPRHAIQRIAGRYYSSPR